MSVTINGSNTPTAGGVTYGDGTTYATTTAGTSGQLLQSNGASAPSWVAAPSTSPAGSTGQVQYNNAGAFGAISSGTSGQVLTSAGAGAAPAWATPAAGGSWVYLSTVTASNSATADVETTFNSTYDVYAIVVNSLVTAAETDIRVRLKVGGSYSTSSIYDWISDRAGTNNPNGTNSVNTATSFIKLTSDDLIYNGAPAASNFVMYVYNPASTSLYKFFSAHGQTTSLGDDKQVTRINHCSNCTSTSALTGVRFYLGTGNIVSGSFRLYGIKTS